MKGGRVIYYPHLNYTAMDYTLESQLSGSNQSQTNLNEGTG